MRKFGWLGIAALAFAVGGAAQAETVKIGVVLPFSGANADLGHQIDKFCGKKPRYVLLFVHHEYFSLSGLIQHSLAGGRLLNC